MNNTQNTPAYRIVDINKGGIESAVHANVARIGALMQQTDLTELLKEKVKEHKKGTAMHKALLAVIELNENHVTNRASYFVKYLIRKNKDGFWAAGPSRAGTDANNKVKYYSECTDAEGGEEGRMLNDVKDSCVCKHEAHVKA